MAHNQRFNVANNETYDPEATEALRALQEILNHTHYIDPHHMNQIKREIRRGADLHVLLERPPSPPPPPNITMEWEPILRENLFERLASEGEADFLQELFAMGLEPTCKVFINAIKAGPHSIQTIEAILHEKPDLINARCDDGLIKNTTPLMAAIKMDVDPEIIEFLLQRGANPNLQATDGQTALMYATKLRTSVVELLLRYGADTQIRNRRGRLAHNHAVSKAMKKLLPSHRGGRKTRRLKRKSKSKSKSHRRR